MSSTTVVGARTLVASLVAPRRSAGARGRVTRVAAAADEQRETTRETATLQLAGLKERTRGSLVQQTLEEMKGDTELQRITELLETKGQQQLTKEERALRRRALEGLGLPDFNQQLAASDIAPLSHAPTTILQINIGLYCNQACVHCHVESSPLRTEQMSPATIDQVVRLLEASPEVRTLDITGGAPELHSEFRRLVAAARALGVDVIDRCNLTVLSEDHQHDLAQFLADHQVKVVASLPCYSAENVDQQRGRGVFEKSIQGLRELNALGYGREGSGLSLDLVYNPGAGFLPPPQATLQEAYKAELHDCYGIVFNSLFTITNMPIKRFADFLLQRHELESYMQLLVDNFNPAAVAGLMCREIVSVRWDGQLYDCDFNQQLDLRIPGRTQNIADVGALAQLTGTRVFTDSHCFGCTAGAGSSCSGTTA